MLYVDPSYAVLLHVQDTYLLPKAANPAGRSERNRQPRAAAQNRRFSLAGLRPRTRRFVPRTAA